MFLRAVEPASRFLHNLPDRDSDSYREVV